MDQYGPVEELMVPGGKLAHITRGVTALLHLFIVLVGTPNLIRRTPWNGTFPRAFMYFFVYGTLLLDILYAIVAWASRPQEREG